MHLLVKPIFSLSVAPKTERIKRIEMLTGIYTEFIKCVIKNGAANFYNTLWF